MLLVFVLMVCISMSRYILRNPLALSLIAQLVKNLPAMQETWVPSLGLGRSPVEENGNPLQNSRLENSMERGARQAIISDCEMGTENKEVIPKEEISEESQPHGAFLEKMEEKLPKVACQGHEFGAVCEEDILEGHSGIHRETMKTVRDFVLMSSKITVDGDCSHEIKRCFAPWKQSYD